MYISQVGRAPLTLAHILCSQERMERAVRQRLEVALANEYQRQLKTIQRDDQKREEDVFRAQVSICIYLYIYICTCMYVYVYKYVYITNTSAS